MIAKDRGKTKVLISTPSKATIIPTSQPLKRAFVQHLVVKAVVQGRVRAWVPGTGSSGYIYVFYVNGSYKRFPDTFVEGTDPVSGGETPPESGLLEPMRGFGKVWRENQDVKTALGWANGAERTATITTLDFERGHMHYVDLRGATLILVQSAPDSGTWRQIVGAS